MKESLELCDVYRAFVSLFQPGLGDDENLATRVSTVPSINDTEVHGQEIYWLEKWRRKAQHHPWHQLLQAKRNSQKVGPATPRRKERTTIITQKPRKARGSYPPRPNHSGICGHNMPAFHIERLLFFFFLSFFLSRGAPQRSLGHFQRHVSPVAHETCRPLQL